MKVGSSVATTLCTYPESDSTQSTKIVIGKKNRNSATYSHFHRLQTELGASFYTYLSTILFTARRLPNCMLEYTPTHFSPRQTAPWADTPLGRHPQKTPPRQTYPLGYYGMRSTSGQYVSYLNAYLLRLIVIFWLTMYK